MNDNLMDDTDDLPLIDPDKDYFAELVGENGKFKTPQDLARSKIEADLYVRHKEREMDNLRADYLKLRDEYNASKKLTEVLDQYNRRPADSISSDNTEANENVNKPAFDPKEVESLVSNKIQEYESQKKQQENFNLVRNKLKERYGSNYQASLKEQIDSLGLDENFVNDLARKHPAVLFRTLGLDSQPKADNFQTPPRSSRNDSFSPAPQKRTWAYYQELRKKDPKAYYDPKTQVQMHKDAIDLGEHFQDGNWASG